MLGNFRFPAPPLALIGIESRCFSLQLCFCSDVCSAPNSWRTRNQSHGFMVGWHKNWSRFASRPAGLLCKFVQL